MTVRHIRFIFIILGLLDTANPLQAAAMLVQPQGPGMHLPHAQGVRSSADGTSTRPPNADPGSRPGLFLGLGAFLMAIATVVLFFSAGYLFASVALLCAIVLGAIGIGKGRRGRIWAMIGLGIAILYQVILAAFVLLIALAFWNG
jgi:hypothetical protein